MFDLALSWRLRLFKFEIPQKYEYKTEVLRFTYVLCFDTNQRLLIQQFKAKLSTTSSVSDI